MSRFICRHEEPEMQATMAAAGCFLLGGGFLLLTVIIAALGYVFSRVLIGI
jgi:hypothetical protein